VPKLDAHPTFSFLKREVNHQGVDPLRGDLRKYRSREYRSPAGAVDLIQRDPMVKGSTHHLRGERKMVVTFPPLFEKPLSPKMFHKGSSSISTV
jgi:hypothetical protein